MKRTPDQDAATGLRLAQGETLHLGTMLIVPTTDGKLNIDRTQFGIEFAEHLGRVLLAWVKRRRGVPGNQCGPDPWRARE